MKDKSIFEVIDYLGSAFQNSGNVPLLAYIYAFDNHFHAILPFTGEEVDSKKFQDSLKTLDPNHNNSFWTGTWIGDALKNIFVEIESVTDAQNLRDIDIQLFVLTDGEDDQLREEEVRNHFRATSGGDCAGEE